MTADLRRPPWIELRVAPRDIELSKEARTRGLFICTSVAFALGRPLRVFVAGAIRIDARIAAVVNAPRELCSRCLGPRRGLVVQAMALADFEALTDLVRRSEQQTSDL